jgi:hypothetical protein
MNLGSLLSAVRSEQISADEGLTNFFANFLDQMPTPSKFDMQEHIDEDHEHTDAIVRNTKALATYLINLGYDPEVIIEQADQAERDFIQTIVDGLRTDFNQQMSADLDDEPPA